ncbi:hypothetical protein GFS60_01366 [Rhodococcus sp. WAY2]|nr:hypothetical protein GFS60_01366 [Rhodococcus sp. WAY2]
MRHVRRLPTRLHVQKSGARLPPISSAARHTDRNSIPPGEAVSSWWIPRYWWSERVR